MNKIKTLILSALAVVALASPSWAGLPWDAENIQNVTGSTPAPTAFPTSNGGVLIDLMTGNTTMGSLSGGVSGDYYTIVIVQDGTGGRTFTAPTDLKHMPSSIPTAANSWTACVVKYDGTNYNVTPSGQCYNNYAFSQDPTIIYKQALANTAIANTASATEASVVAPGMTASKGCIAVEVNPGADEAKGLFVSCVPNTNYVQVKQTNPTAATITPTAGTVYIRAIGN